MKEHEQLHDIHGSDRQQLKETSEGVKDVGDLLSGLPDALLLHIMCFLKMPDVVRTCVLSSRWRYLWTTIPCLNFQIEDWELEGYTDFVTFIDRSICSYEGSKVRTFLIGCIYDDTESPHVDSWIRFAVRHNVEIFSLDLLYGYEPNKEDWYGPRYKLPQSLFCCRSLTYLELTLCDLNLPASIQLSSLHRLVLGYLDLSVDVIRQLTSNCPLLKYMYLEGCNGYSNLNIFIANHSLKFLDISESRLISADTELTIYAPNLHSLCFQRCLPRAKYHIKNLPCLETAAFGDFSYEADLKKVHNENDHYDGFVGILRDLHHVKELDICRFFIQVLYIRGMQSFDTLSLDTACLKLQTDLTKWELPGVSYLLKSSSKLETLKITLPKFGDELKFSDEFKDKFNFEEKEFWNSEKFDFLSQLEKLKFVQIYFSSGTQPIDDVDKSLEKLENKIEFTSFLLRNSKVLEKMIIRCGNQSPSNNFELLFKLTEKLISIPRASPNAALYIS